MSMSLAKGHEQPKVLVDKAALPFIGNPGDGMDTDVPFVELMKQKILWEEWYTRRFSGINVGTLNPEERKLLEMDPNKLLDPALLNYLRREVRS
jgi:hypothetical protein